MEAVQVQVNNEVNEQTRALSRTAHNNSNTQITDHSSCVLLPSKSCVLSSASATVLLVGKCAQRETGNSTTLTRLGRAVRDGGWQCVIRDVDTIPHTEALRALVKQCNIVSVVGLHAYRSAQVLLSCQELGMPYVTIFGGTDVNECVRDEVKKQVMDQVIEGAHSLIAFHALMRDTVLQVWNFLPHDKLWIMPQAIEVNPDPDFNIVSYLEKIEETHLNNRTDHINLETKTSNFNDEDNEKFVKSTIKYETMDSEDRNVIENVSCPENGSSTQDTRIPTLNNNLHSQINVNVGDSRKSDLTETQELPGQFQPLVVLVAGLRPVKDVLFLTKAWSDWQQARGGRGRFLIIGPSIDPHYTIDVNTHLNRLSGVRLCPTISPEDCQALIKHATALVNSSRSEGMASSILEAMALGTPVIVRDIPGNTSLVTHRQSGLVYSSPETFIRELDTLLQDSGLRERMVAAAKVRVLQNHSLQQEKDLFLRILNGVVN